MQPMASVQGFWSASPKKAKSEGYQPTVVEAGSEVEGRLICHGPARICGKVTGTIFAHDLLVIEEGAVVEAEITAEKAILHGIVRGKLSVHESVSLSRTAVFAGDISAPTIEMEEGARFDGTSRMSDAPREADPDIDEATPSPVHKLQYDLEEFIG